MQCRGPKHAVYNVKTLEVYHPISRIMKSLLYNTNNMKRWSPWKPPVYIPYLKSFRTNTSSWTASDVTSQELPKNDVINYGKFK
jgi:hypothetical protein